MGFRVGLELIAVGPSVGEDDVESIMLHASIFFNQHCDREVERVKTAEGYDLQIGGVEVGSYGVRSHRGFKWAYGTGLAEPRFSTVARRFSVNDVYSPYWMRP